MHAYIHTTHWISDKQFTVFSSAYIHVCMYIWTDTYHILPKITSRNQHNNIQIDKHTSYVASLPCANITNTYTSKYQILHIC